MFEVGSKRPLARVKSQEPTVALPASRFASAAVLLMVCLCAVSPAALPQRIQKAVGQQQDSNDYSIHVIEPESGTVVYSHNARKPLMPASNMKLVTTAAALRYLGPNFEYRTRIGRHQGALVVIGNGDPLLGDKSTDSRRTVARGAGSSRRSCRPCRSRDVTEVNAIYRRHDGLRRSAGTSELAHQRSQQVVGLRDQRTELQRQLH
jgi:hypothetical protein